MVSDSSIKIYLVLIIYIYRWKHIFLITQLATYIYIYIYTGIYVYIYHLYTRFMDNLFHRNTNYFSTCSSISHQSTIRYHTSSELTPDQFSSKMPSISVSSSPAGNTPSVEFTGAMYLDLSYLSVSCIHEMNNSTVLFWVPKKLVIFGHPPLGPDQRTTKKGVDAMLPGKGSPQLVVTKNTQCMVHFPGPTCTPYTTELWKKIYQLHWVAGNSEPRIMCRINLYLKIQNPNGKTPKCFNMF